MGCKREGGRKYCWPKKGKTDLGQHFFMNKAFARNGK